MKPENDFYLLPNKVKYLSVLFFIIAAIFGYMYFFVGKPEILQVKVFAVVTSYLKTQTFVVSQTNLTDEIAEISAVIGLFFLILSKEKNENSKLSYNNLRLKAFIKSVYFTLIFWAVCFLTIFGLTIFVVSSLIFIAFLLIYYVILKFEIYKSPKNRLKILNK